MHFLGVCLLLWRLDRGVLPINAGLSSNSVESGQTSGLRSMHLWGTEHPESGWQDCSQLAGAMCAQMFSCGQQTWKV